MMAERDTRCQRSRRPSCTVLMIAIEVELSSPTILQGLESVLRLGESPLLAQSMSKMTHNPIHALGHIDANRLIQSPQIAIHR
jgi:hypothetical protein